MLEFMCNITLWIQLSQKEYNTVLGTCLSKIWCYAMLDCDVMKGHEKLQKAQASEHALGLSLIEQEMHGGISVCNTLTLA